MWCDFVWFSSSLRILDGVSSWSPQSQTLLKLWVHPSFDPILSFSLHFTVLSPHCFLLVFNSPSSLCPCLSLSLFVCLSVFVYLSLYLSLSLSPPPSLSPSPSLSFSLPLSLPPTRWEFSYANLDAWNGKMELFAGELSNRVLLEQRCVYACVYTCVCCVCKLSPLVFRLWRE